VVPPAFAANQRPLLRANGRYRLLYGVIRGFFVSPPCGSNWPGYGSAEWISPDWPAASHRQQFSAKDTRLLVSAPIFQSILT
jgi:hypothetical protein